jgi:hypothetical protein
MGDSEDLVLLRGKYERALTNYESVCAALNHHLRAGTTPSAEEIRREREIRAALELARHEYLEAWKQS